MRSHAAPASRSGVPRLPAVRRQAARHLQCQAGGGGGGSAGNNGGRGGGRRSGGGGGGGGGSGRHLPAVAVLAVMALDLADTRRGPARSRPSAPATAGLQGSVFAAALGVGAAALASSLATAAAAQQRQQDPALSEGQEVGEEGEGAEAQAGAAAAAAAGLDAVGLQAAGAADGAPGAEAQPAPPKRLVLVIEPIQFTYMSGYQARPLGAGQRWRQGRTAGPGCPSGPATQPAACRRPLP